MKRKGKQFSRKQSQLIVGGGLLFYLSVLVASGLVLLVWRRDKRNQRMEARQAEIPGW